MLVNGSGITGLCELQSIYSLEKLPAGVAVPTIRHDVIAKITSGAGADAPASPATSGPSGEWPPEPCLTRQALTAVRVLQRGS